MIKQGGGLCVDDAPKSLTFPSGNISIFLLLFFTEHGLRMVSVAKNIDQMFKIGLELDNVGEVVVKQ